MSNRFKLIPAVHLILIRNKKVLLLQRANTGWQDDNYSVPAGHLDGDETVIEAMIRECNEEIGIDISQSNTKVIHVMHRNEWEERIDFFLSVDQWRWKIKNCEPEKCSDLSWFPVDNIPENMVPYVRHAIEQIQEGRLYSEFGWE